MVVNDFQDGFAGFSDDMIPLTSGEEFEEAVQKLADTIHENSKVQGALSKRQTKRLKGILSDIRSELMQAWIRGEDLETLFRKLEFRLECEPEQDDFSCVCPLGEPFKIGDDVQGEGKWLKVRNRVALDSACSVLVITSGWQTWFLVESSEVARRGQRFIAFSGDGARSDSRQKTESVIARLPTWPTPAKSLPL